MQKERERRRSKDLVTSYNDTTNSTERVDKTTVASEQYLDLNLHRNIFQRGFTFHGTMSHKSLQTE